MIPHDVEFSGVGLLPIALSPSANRDGWTQLVKLPAQTWPSPELEAFFQRDFYDGRAFSQVIALPMLRYLTLFPIFLFGMIDSRHEIVQEWRQLYAGPFGDDLIFDVAVLKRRFIASFKRWKEGRDASLERIDGAQRVATKTPGQKIACGVRLLGSTLEPRILRLAAATTREEGATMITMNTFGVCPVFCGWQHSLPPRCPCRRGGRLGRGAQAP